MSTNVPRISVTADTNKHDHQHSSTSSDTQDDSNLCSNDLEYNSNMGGGLTDVEDFDSNAEFDRSCSRRSSINSLFVLQGIASAQGDITDVEDYNDSEADEEDINKSRTYPELKLSLEEFLQNDVQEHLSTSNGFKQVVQHKSGNFLKAQNLNANSDYLTDCEEYNTDSEMEKNFDKSVCVDLDDILIEPGRFNIVDTVLRTKERSYSDCEYEDVSDISEISDLASAISDINGKEIHGMSEDEVIELSGNEEICQISCSDSESLENDTNLSEENLLSSASLPPIDVTFIQPCNKAKLETDQFLRSTLPKSQIYKTIFLKVEEEKNKKEEVLTDVERFDDSVAEDDDDSFDNDDDNQQPIPQAVILAIGDDGACHTDCEDIMCDEISEMTGSSAELAMSVDHNVIPLPHREVVVFQENKFGDTITNVMPMNKEHQFGIYITSKEECITDTEEFSCAEDVDIQEQTVNLSSWSPSPNNVVMGEPEVTVANELLKVQQSKRLEIIANTESVTDVEEIYMAGTNSRRKKVKTRNLSKNKAKYLETPKIRNDLSGRGTDIEDMDLSDNGIVTHSKPISKCEQNLQQNYALTDKATDIEVMTADDTSFISDIEPPQIDESITNLKYYEKYSKNCVVSLETCNKQSCLKHKKIKNTTVSQLPRDNELASDHRQQQQTDIEDVQLPSDTEECAHTNAESTADDVCQELNEMLNECCTTVHDKCTNSFNVDAEKLHIKGMLRESHTDIEYVESDESAARGTK